MGPSVLLYDRSTEESQMFAALFGVANCRFRAFEEVEPAFRAVAVDPPDVVISRVWGTLTPEAARLTLTARIRAHDGTAHIPVLMLGTTIDPGIDALANAIGAIRHRRLPILPDALIVDIDRMHRLNRLRDGSRRAIEKSRALMQAVLVESARARLQRTSAERTARRAADILARWRS